MEEMKSAVMAQSARLADSLYCGASAIDIH